MASPHWYVRVLNVECGPMALVDVVSLARKGTLAKTDLVRSAGRNWAPAGEFVELFPRPSIVRNSTHALPKPELPHRSQAASRAERSWTLEIAMLLCGAVLVMQLFPDLFLGVVRYVDVRTWSWRSYVAANLVLVVLLLCLKIRKDASEAR